MKAFIFDMDGVIIDSEPIHNRVIKDFLQNHGYEITDEELDRYVGMTSTSVFTILKQKYHLPASAEELTVEHMNEFKTYIAKHHIQPIEGIKELLIKLQQENIPMAIASSSPLDVIEFVAKSFAITDYFAFLISGENMPQGKPAPDIYLHTAAKLNVTPTDCVVLEDSKNGSIAAKTAGMYCIGFANPNSGNQDLSRADIIVHNINEINLENL